MRSFCLVVSLACSFLLSAQGEIPVEVGKSCPEIIAGAVRSSTSKDQPTIIDLFSSDCVVCFQNMPKVNDLQRKFRDQINFILWGEEDGRVQTLYRKFEKGLNLRLNVIFDSSIFRRIKKDFVPTYIWIDGKGTVQAITGPDQLSETNLNKFLEGRFTYDVRNAQPRAFDRFAPYLINSNGGDELDCIFRSLLTYWDNTKPKMWLSSLTYFHNLPFFQAMGVKMSSLYFYAYFGAAEYWGPGDISYGKVWPKVEVQNTMRGKECGINVDSLFCYCLYIPHKTKSEKQLQDFMRRDLYNYFGFSVRVVSRQMPCWYLVRRPCKCNLKSKSDSTMVMSTHAGFEYQNASIKSILDLLFHYYPDEPPFIDRTGINYGVDLKVNAILTNFEDLRNGLNKLGLVLKKGTTQMKVIELY